MPKFPKGFGRRKSHGNELNIAQEASSSEPSFKVFERDDGAGQSFDGGKKFAKSPTLSLRPKISTLDDENMFESVYNRDSGASNTNTISTTDNSSRLSAASTAPSSTDVPRRDEWKSPHDKPFTDIPLPPIPKSASTFSLKNAGRTLSWGRNGHKSQTPPLPTTKEPAFQSVDGDLSGRQRAVTASSYASTATPPRLDDNDLGLSLGGDFSDMFNGIGKVRSAVLDAGTNRAASRSPDAGPSGPAIRSLTAGRFNQPSPLNIDKNENIEPSPYSWSSQNSREGLISGASPIFAPRKTPPPVPQHNTAPRTNNDNTASHSRTQVPGGQMSGLRRSSAVMEPKRQSNLDYGDTVDEDARLLRESVTASRRINDPGNASKIPDSWAFPSDSSFKVDDATIASWGTGSVDATPKARKPGKKLSEDEDNMFDVQITAAANLAQQFNERPPSPKRQTATQNKVMTPAQFERYKHDQERLRNSGGPSKDEEEEDDEPYDDDEDQAEKNKQLAKQRRKQEAHMAVYRQQMMKVTGEALPQARPNVFATQSSPNLANGINGDEGEEEDEEVPLAILQAHGFPNKGKQPMRNMSSNPNFRSGAQSAAGGVVGADSRLPVFARNLPQDPYVGAGLVSPIHRESMAFAGGAGSVNGGAAPRGHPPGGLVGVIATEERSRAMRRGSPNQQGEYGAPQGNGFNSLGMQQPAGGSMYNGTGLMNPMMMTPGDQAQMQMSQQMQQFMHMQMQFMQMMTAGGQGGQGQPPKGHMPSQSMDGSPKPGSAQKMRPGSSNKFSTHQRAMTMLDPNAIPWMQGGGSMYSPSVLGHGGYTPSIAPSERSNVGLPGRYRPVSQAPPQAQDNKARASTMSALGWGNKNIPTIKTVNKTGNISDEDDEEGWEEMAKKRAKKKSLWRTKKDNDHNGLKEMMGYTQ
ncbi:hypothetical protein WAI453_006996 [Rhynchosporium graminicola]